AGGGHHLPHQPRAVPEAQERGGCGGLRRRQGARPACRRAQAADPLGGVGAPDASTRETGSVAAPAVFERALGGCYAGWPRVSTRVNWSRFTTTISPSSLRSSRRSSQSLWSLA